MNSSEIAKICHEANRALCEILGDKVAQSWDEFPAQMKVPTIKGVELIVDEPNTTESEIHQSWCNDKKLQGYKYGPQKDDEKKTHPNLVEWDKLPHNQKLKDKLFISIVKTFL